MANVKESMPYIVIVAIVAVVAVVILVMSAGKGIGTDREGALAGQASKMNVQNAKQGFYTGATVVCYDGSRHVLGGRTSCKPASTWEQYAEFTCMNSCSGANQTGKCGVNSYSIGSKC